MFGRVLCFAFVGAEAGVVPGNEGCKNPPDRTAPQFHLQDQTGCQLNDPNGPFFDPVHGIYHLMYQDHQAATPGAGPDYGHWLSRDLIHWVQMPMAIWNGLDVTSPGNNLGYKATPYDSVAIFTGSAAVVPGFGPDGQSDGVIQIYPGICATKSWPSCSGGKSKAKGQVLAVAVPHNYASDPLLTNWTKPSYNPIIPTIQRDPSEPWKTQHGEWRLRTYDGMEYGTASDADMKAGKWYTIGHNPAFPTAECPSYFPLPKATPGFEVEYNAHLAVGSLPNRVQKLSRCPGIAGLKDAVQIGMHADGKPGELSSFVAAPGWEDLLDCKVIDQGIGYAAKDHSAPGGRRINWAWLRASPNGVQSLPQEVTFNPVMRQLEWAPIKELHQLRGQSLAVMEQATLNGPVNLDLPESLGNTSEVEVMFVLPNTSSTFGVWVMASKSDRSVGTYFSVDFVLNTNSSIPWHEVGVSAVSATQPCYPGCKDVLRISKKEATLQLNLFVDNTFTEAFWQNGRTHLSVRTPASEDANMFLDTSTSIKIKSAKVWAMKPIWVTKEEVLATPRPDVFEAII